MNRQEGNGLKIPKMKVLLYVCQDILRHGPPMNYDTCPTERNHSPMKVLLQNTQTVKSRFEFQTASRLYEETIISTSYQANNNDISTVSKDMKTESTEMTKGIKSSYKYFVTYDRDSKKIKFQNDLTNTSTIEHSNMIDGNVAKLFSKVSSFIKSYIFDMLAVNHVTCYSAYKDYNLTFYGEPVRKHKNITILSLAQFL